jgi:hypothetical protein
MTDLTTRIRRVTEDLQAIQHELSTAAKSPATDAERDRIMQALASSDLLHEFKSSVDHMRHLLWSYIESAQKNEDVRRTLERVRMKRVTEMLHILEPDVSEKRMHDLPEIDSFFDAVQKIASKALDRHEDKK